MLSKSNSRLKIEKYPLPDSIDGILSLLREIMSAGQVQRIEFSTDSPVRVSRVVQDEGDPDLVEPNLGLDGVLRNIEMVEYFSEDATQYQVLVDMMQIIRKEGLNCVCWATGLDEDDLLNRWLEFDERGMPSGVEYLLDRPVFRIKSLPEDTLILCGSNYPSAEHNELTVAVKTAIEVRRPKNEQQRLTVRKASDPVRDSPPEYGSAVGQLEIAPGGLRTVDWKRSGVSRE